LIIIDILDTGALAWAERAEKDGGKWVEKNVACDLEFGTVSRMTACAFTYFR
jgi:hypothetical protein